MPPIQWLTVGVTFFVIFICILRLRLTPQKKFIRLPVIAVMIHVVIFYLFVALKDFNIYSLPNQGLDFSSWSSVLRFHSLLTYALIEAYGYWRDKWNNLP